LRRADRVASRPEDLDAEGQAVAVALAPPRGNAKIPPLGAGPPDARAGGASRRARPAERERIRLSRHRFPWLAPDDGFAVRVHHAWPSRRWGSR
jgi:hypothetical protein